MENSEKLSNNILSEELESESIESKIITKKTPPVSLKQRIPKAPDLNHVWIPGRWALRGDSFKWIDGKWKLPPVAGEMWTPGWWNKTAGGFEWVNGYWGKSVGYHGGIDLGGGYNGFEYTPPTKIIQHFGRRSRNGWSENHRLSNNISLWDHSWA